MCGTQAINAIVTDPFIAEVIYVGTNHGVYKTEDGGGEWRSANMGIGNRFVITLALNPRNKKIMMARNSCGDLQNR